MKEYSQMNCLNQQFNDSKDSDGWKIPDKGERITSVMDSDC